jgi:hypothetical protein
MDILLKRRKPIVFGGPSIALWSKEERGSFEIRPPIQRRDLNDLIDTPPGICIIIDGVFGGKMSITPTECRVLLEKGWMLLGSSSMGALRAADLWSLGMIGVGDIYNMYRLGKCTSDAEVAVVYDQDTFEEKTISLVHVKSILGYLSCRGEIDRGTAEKLLTLGKKIIWFERLPQYLEQVWSDILVKQDLRHLFQDPLLHPKKQDALHLLKLVNAFMWSNEN